MQTLAYTDLSSLIPEIYRPLAQAKLAEFVNFSMAGLVDQFPIGAGDTMPIPGFGELAGTIDIIGDNYDPQVNKITALKDIGVVRHLGKAYGADDLARIVTGLDPNAAIAAQIANYFARYAIQDSFLSILKGLFNSSGGILYTANRYSVYADVASTAATYAVMTPTIASLGMAKLGDQMGKIRAWLMHSKVVADLAAQGFILPATNTPPVGFDGSGVVQTFLGKPIVMADTVTSTAGTSSTMYRTFGVTSGAFALGMQQDLNPEQDRNTLKKLNYIATDLHFCAHVRGTAFAGSTGSGLPTATTLETGATWTLAAENAKYVGVVAIDTN